MLNRTKIETECKTGEECPESGVWETGTTLLNLTTIPLSKGETFPPYQGKSVSWRLKQYA